MVADLFSARVKQIRIRRLQNPLILIGVILVGAAHVNLDTLARGCEGKRIGWGTLRVSETEGAESFPDESGSQPARKIANHEEIRSALFIMRILKPWSA